jgi:DNA-binding LacI/PurR family transcriptional regulator
MGAAAMRLLLAILAGEAPASVRLPWEMVVRESTCSAR